MLGEYAVPGTQTTTIDSISLIPKKYDYFRGSCFRFSAVNYKPAKIFLGDNGSFFIGYMMAAFTLFCRYDNPEVGYATFFVPLMAFGVPLYDIVSVAVARFLRGILPWKGDRNQFAHRLVKIGMEDKIAAHFSYFMAITLVSRPF